MKISLSIFISLFISAISFSQNKTGAGNVSSITGIAIPNAIVHLSPVSDTSVVFEYICDKNGNYNFDIASADSVFTLNILPSVQTLQFNFTQVDISLTDGSNGMFFHTVETVNTKGIRFTVVDTAGIPVSGAKILLYDTERKWRVDSCSIAKTVYTDANGQAEVNSLLPVKYWFNIRKDYTTNRFTVKNTGTAIDTSAITEITDTIRGLTQKELYMTGLCDNKTWITDSLMIYGVSQQYDADSKLLSDGTWYDSNDNHGYWWFNALQTKITYNYDTTSANGGGSTVVATLLTLNDSIFIGNMQMFGLPVKYFMSVVYDTAGLYVSAQDTTVYLGNNGTVTINTDDLYMNTNYSFASEISISQSVFTASDLGDNEVYITLNDQCGNSVTDTITVTVLQSLSVNDVTNTNINLFPNPGNDFAVIECSEMINYIEISDVRGYVIEKIRNNSGQCIIDISGLSPGLYNIGIYTAKGVIYKKLITE